MELPEELTDSTLDGTRKASLTELSTVPILIIDNLQMRKLRPTTTEDLLELTMRRYERASTILSSNRPWRTGARVSAPPLRSPPSSTASCAMPT